MSRPERPAEIAASPRGVQNDDRANARKAFAMRQFSEAIRFFERARRHSPKDVPLMLELAQAYGLNRQFAEASTLLSEAMNAEPHRAEVFGVAGRVYDQIRRHEDASHCYAQAAKLNPRSVAAFTRLAATQERTHQLKAARKSVQVALSINPNTAEASLIEAILDRREGRLDSANTRLRRLIDQSPPREIAWKSWYELAFVLDRQSDFQGAMSSLRKAKSILQEDETRWLDESQQASLKLRQTQEAIIPAYTLDWQRRQDEVPSDREPQRRMALLTGHPRSGTTLLEQAIESHPSVISAEETPLLGGVVHDPIVMRHDPSAPMADILDQLRADELDQLSEAYWTEAEKVLGSQVGDRLLLDKNPDALSLLPTVIRVFPDTKLLVAIRDPRDVCLSCYMQPLEPNRISVNFLELERTVDRYLEIMGFWTKMRKMLTPSSWIEIRYEDVVRNLRGELERALEHLDLPWDDNVEQFQANARNKYVHSPSYEAVTQGLHTGSIGRWRNYEKHLEPLLERLEPFCQQWGYD